MPNWFVPRVCFNPPKRLMFLHFSPALFCILEWAILWLWLNTIFYIIPVLYFLYFRPINRDICRAPADSSSYRIKPESKYRPFKNAEECWQEMLKHQPFGWVKMKDTESGYYILKGIANQVVIGLNETPFSYKKVFEDYIFADGTPFGVKVEE